MQVDVCAKQNFLYVIHAILGSAGGQMMVHFKRNGTYSVSVNKQPWLTSAATFFRVNGMKHCTSDGSLKQIGEPRDMSGEDVLGTWNGQTVSFSAGGAKVSVLVRCYDIVGGQLAIFTQVSVNINVIFSPPYAKLMQVCDDETFWLIMFNTSWCILFVRHVHCDKMKAPAADIQITHEMSIFCFLTPTMMVRDISST